MDIEIDATSGTTLKEKKTVDVNARVVGSVIVPYQPTWWSRHSWPLTIIRHYSPVGKHEWTITDRYSLNKSLAMT